MHSESGNTSGGWPGQVTLHQSDADLGRLKVASYFIGGGGLFVLLSAFLPWVSALGLASANLPGPEVVIFLILGGSLTFLASNVFRNRATSTVRVLLWVLAVLEILAVLVGFVLLQASAAIDGAVGPGAGFFLALIGLLASVVGTIIQQTAKAGPVAVPVVTSAAAQSPAVPATPTPAPPPQSPDGRYWWDGTVWVSYQ